MKNVLDAIVVTAMLLATLAVICAFCAIFLIFVPHGEWIMIGASVAGMYLSAYKTLKTEAKEKGGTK